MAFYSYTVLNHHGDILKATGEFDSPQSLFESVQKDGLTLVKYHRSLFGGSFLKSRSLSRVQLAEFFRNLALLLKGGIPLRDSLNDLTSGSDQKDVGRVFGQVTKRLEEGMMFSEALQFEEKHIPKIIFPLVAIGEETGNLDRTLEDAADHLEKIQNIISSTRRALTYPVFVLLAMLGALIFWMVYVLPQVLDLFSTMGIKELPVTTQILIASISLFNAWWPLIPCAIVVFILAYLISRKNTKLRYWWDVCIIHTPLIGTIVRSSQLAFFFEYTGLLSSSGIHIVRSLELMHNSIDNEILKRAINAIKEDITGGSSMYESMAQLSFFEPFILRMVKVGEQTGNMSEQFTLLADFYLKKVNNLVETLGKTLEPIIIVFAGLVFIIIVLGLLGPVYQLVSNIK